MLYVLDDGVIPKPLSRVLRAAARLCDKPTNAAKKLLEPDWRDRQALVSRLGQPDPAATAESVNRHAPQVLVHKIRDSRAPDLSPHLFDLGTVDSEGLYEGRGWQQLIRWIAENGLDAVR